MVDKLNKVFDLCEKLMKENDRLKQELIKEKQEHIQTIINFQNTIKCTRESLYKIELQGLNLINKIK